jgi:type IV secretory pathway TrbL component
VDVTKVTFFVELLQAFKDALSRAQDLIYPWVFLIFSVLALLALMLAVARGVESSKMGKALVIWVLKIAALGWIIARWDWLFTLITRQGIDMGLHMAGDRITRAAFLNPGAYYQLGLDIGMPLLQALDTSVMVNMVQVVLSPVMTVMYFLAWLTFCVGFFVMGLTVFMIQIEQAFAIPTLLALLPFLACAQTGWVGQGAVTYGVKLAFRFLMLALIAGVVYPVTETILLTKPDLRQACMMACAAITFVVVFLKGSRMAGDIMSGVFTLGGGSMAEAGMLVMHTLTAGKTMILEGARRGWSAAGNVLDTATAGRATLSTIPPPRVPSSQLHTTLTNAARSLYG